jgi:hypothetical protein
MAAEHAAAAEGPMGEAVAALSMTAIVIAVPFSKFSKHMMSRLWFLRYILLRYIA